MQLQFKEAVLDLDDSLAWVPFSLYYLVRHGSQAYGTATPTSDLDVKGIVIPPIEYVTGFVHRDFKQIEHQAPDYVLYDLRRYMQLAAACNPNIIEMLWVHPSDHLHVNPVIEELINKRDLFISRLAADTFSGYAHNQLKRIKSHRAWLMNPPKKKPERGDFSLPEISTVSDEQIKAAQHLNDKGFSYDTNFQELVRREKQYDQARRQWDSYVNWQQNRNPARHALEAQFGYDTKHAMHLVRLIRMCKEIMGTGIVRVRRPDAEDLLDIRRGAWSYDQLIEWADRNKAAIDAMVDYSPLPARPDVGKLDCLCQSLVEIALNLNGYDPY